MTDEDAKYSERKFYHELTLHQQKVVDYLAENPGETVTEAADGLGCSKGSVSEIKGQYSHIIEEREAQLNNRHLNESNRGNVSVVGELDLSDESEYPKPQGIKDRPYSSGGDCSDLPEPQEGEIAVKLPPEVVWRAIRGELTESDRWCLFNEVTGAE